jgi:hypothetical protein
MRFRKLLLGTAIGALLVAAAPVAANSFAAPADVSPLRAYHGYTKNSEVTGDGKDSGETWGNLTIVKQGKAYKVTAKGNVRQRWRVTAEPGQAGPYFWAYAYAEYDYWDGYRWYHRDAHALGRDMPQPTGSTQVATPYEKVFTSVANFHVFVCLANPEHAMPQGCGARV